jgi:hypothetical protein
MDQLYLESAIDGVFNGWRQEGHFRLSNGEVWEQVSKEYKYSNTFKPRVRIYRGNVLFFIEVQGMEGRVQVRKVSP